MNAIKELYTLAKMLFTSRPSDKEYVDLLFMRHFPFKGKRAMSWCGYIIMRYEYYEEMTGEVPPVWYADMARHEKMHLLQAKHTKRDSWMYYYLSYVWQWIKLNPLVYPSNAAYYCNPYEVEAYANEQRQSYLENYTGEHLRGKYTIPHAKRIYKSLGATPQAWKAYIKTI